MMRVAGLVLSASIAVSAMGCDTPPDIHVYAYSTQNTPAEVALWRVRRSYRLRPRQIERLEPSAFTTYEGPARFRVTPLGELPKYERIRIDLERHDPTYRSAGPMRITVLTNFVPDQHLRLDVWFAPFSFAGPTAPDAGGSVGGGCGVVAPECRPATPEEMAAFDGPPADPVEEGDVDPDETPFAGDPPSTAPSVPPCAFVCETLPMDDGSTAPMFMPITVDRRDAGMDASDAEAGSMDSGIPLEDAHADAAPGFDAPYPSVCNGADNDCDGIVDNGPCPAGSICTGNRCVPMCVEGGCGAGQTCTSAGTCVDSACAAVTCSPPEVCVAGMCVDRCAGVSCAAGQLCRGGRCLNACPDR